MQTAIPRNEYPRPQFVRNQWINLNGEWDFSFDTDTLDKTIVVPYAYQTKLSGIDDQEFHDVVWYRKTFSLPEDTAGKDLLLHFGAVDYYCKVWINGQYVGEHTGGHIGFTFPITPFLQNGENELKVMAEDPASDLEMPRGKQFWEKRSSGIFYTRTTGIWQTVWLEAVDTTRLEHVWLTPNLDSLLLEVEYLTHNAVGAELDIAITYNTQEVAKQTVKLLQDSGRIAIGLCQSAVGEWHPEAYVWTPETPRLFDITFIVHKSGQVTDKVESYFGLRKVSVEDGKFCLNNRPYYQKLLLDQGYWEESLLTAPSDDAFALDIRLAKEMGFNGVRKHQKIEDPRFFYHADKMGFLVWGEIGAAYAYSRKYVKRITDEWIEEINRDYNHPSIVAWTPINESWGVPNIMNRKDQQHHSAAMVYLTKSLDTTRLVISNDGWEHTCTDLLTIHDYQASKEILAERYQSLESTLNARPSGRPFFATGWAYDGQPILVTEYGGISFKKSGWDGWGYSSAANEEDFALRYYNVTSPLLESPVVQGFCYTQLTDVEQEINGLLTYDRKPKIEPEIIRAINESRWIPEQNK